MFITNFQQITTAILYTQKHAFPSDDNQLCHSIIHKNSNNAIFNREDSRREKKKIEKVCVSYPMLIPLHPSIGHKCTTNETSGEIVLWCSLTPVVTTDKGACSAWKYLGWKIHYKCSHVRLLQGNNHSSATLTKEDIEDKQFLLFNEPHNKFHFHQQ